METQHEIATRYLWEGKAAEAVSILDGLPETPDVLNDRAVSLYMLNEKDIAINILDRALDMKPDHGPAQLNSKYMRIVQPHAPSRYRVLEDWGAPPGPAPAISVIMPHYNRAEFLEEAVRSALDQTRSDLEIVIANDGGNRDCEAIIENIGLEKIRYLYIEHGGQSVALNAALAHARGRYIAYLDDDDIYYPKHVETLAEYLDARPDAMVAFAHAVRAEQTFSNGKWIVTERKIVNREPYNRERMLRSNRMTAPHVVMHRREAIDAVGGFHEGLMAAKDWDLWLRIGAQYEFHRVDEVTSEHRIRTTGETQITARVMRQRHYDNFIIYLHKITPITSLMPGNASYNRAMRIFGGLALRHPEALDAIDLRYLRSRPKKWYPMFYAMGKGLLGEGLRDAAKDTFLAAAAAAPWEPKMYLAYAKAAMGVKRW